MLIPLVKSQITLVLGRARVWNVVILFGFLMMQFPIAWSAHIPFRSRFDVIIAGISISSVYFWFTLVVPVEKYCATSALGAVHFYLEEPRRLHFPQARLTVISVR